MPRPKNHVHGSGYADSVPSPINTGGNIIMTTTKTDAQTVLEALEFALNELRIIGFSELKPDMSDFGAMAKLNKALPAAQRLVDGWLPIDSAPKTGQVIILYGKTRHAEFHHVGVGHWYKTYNKWAWDGYVGDEPKQPTKWQPLPTPPTTSEEV
jgi:hypothetical protein